MLINKQDAFRLLKCGNHGFQEATAKDLSKVKKNKSFFPSITQRCYLLWCYKDITSYSRVDHFQVKGTLQWNSVCFVINPRTINITARWRTELFTCQVHTWNFLTQKTFSQLYTTNGKSSHTRPNCLAFFRLPHKNLGSHKTPSTHSYGQPLQSLSIQEYSSQHSFIPFNEHLRTSFLNIQFKTAI